MIGHEIVGGRLRPFPDRSWAADCTCGWVGPVRALKGDAAGEWVRHVRAAVGKSAENHANKVVAA